jgi:DNA polymerase-1
MVAHRSFLIDATFLLDEAERAFLGSAPIVNSRGQNTSVIYGAVRAMLRLRGTLGIAYGIVVVGAEAKAVSSAANIEMFCDCLRAIGTCTSHEVGIPVGALCQSMLHEREVRWIVTQNKSLMQLVGASCRIILTAEGGAPDVITEDALASRFGIRPDQVPSLLALTDTCFIDPLTTKQAARLLEVCGSLDAAFKSSSAEAASTRTRRYLNANKAALLTQLRNLTVIPHVAQRPRRLPMSPLVRNNAASRSALREQGFPSLGRLLATPESVELVTTARDREEAYVAVVDPAGLRSLKAVLANADVCVVDTEATDKDPRRARLLGVALAVREGQAFYVPVTAPDLRDVSPASVIDILRELLARRVGIVGHNLKYDYVLLRRHGIQIGDTYFDTMLAAHECFGDWEFFNLGAVSKRLLGREVKRYRDMVGQCETPQDVPFRELVEHGCADVDATLRRKASAISSRRR